MNSTKTPHKEIAQISKPRGYRFWLPRIVLLLGLPLLFYYGYCWGLWGRGSLLLQYLFQCTCPPASEEARYPEEVDVIVPACRQSYVELSPSGRLLAVREEQAGLPSTYLLDLQSMGRTEITNQPFSIFLTDNLALQRRFILLRHVEYYYDVSESKNRGKTGIFRRFKTS